ncbi:flotillin family protein [Actinomyces massiliensis]|uniref:SPFH domain/Band 7 family protein n=1 Tax=Actinomyces massiliensis F0489 TaxID=1125718 RepID=J0N0Y9_9ACTO|nr:flotillin family protein [Actinomyces massiliensis]EJF38037.1 SPFH domain/Band 7 family protein [Actinomyces massiliensis F0489]WLD71626.1 SPFH domain-containing protein [Actinomyces massiliensis]
MMLYAIIALVVLAVLLGLYMLSRVVVVPSNLTGLVAGSTRNGEIKIIRPGGRDFVLPIIQSIQYLPFTQNTIGFRVTAEDENKINVDVSAVAAVKVGDSDEQVRAAAKRFLGKPNTDQAIADSARNALIGSLRSIVGHMTITDLISDRDALQQNVFDDAKSVMANMGLEIDVLQISEITDEGGYIESLGVPEQQRVEKDARIARANAEREAKDAEVTSRQQIAERERDLSLRQAQLKSETDKAQAEADSAGPLARAAKEREIAIIGQEAAQAKAALTERELDSTVRKPADAARYQREQEAEASKAEAIRKAEAEAERTRLDAQAQAQATVARAEAEARATAARAKAEAEAIAARGRAEAEAVQAAGEAEAKAMSDKADALDKYGEAATQQMVLDKAPDIARALAEPMGSVKDMSIISTDGASALPKAVAGNVEQLNAVMRSLTGSDLTDMLGRFIDDKGDKKPGV